MYLQAYLIRRKEGGQVRFHRKEALGDIIFLPDRYQPFFSLEGYRLWSGSKITAHGKMLRIYVLAGLMNKGGDF